MLVLVFVVIMELERSFRTIDNFKYLFAVKHIPRCSNNNRCIVLFAEHSNYFINLFGFHSAGTAENDSICVCYLIIVKLAEVLHIHFALCRIRNSGSTEYLHIIAFNLGNSSKHVGKLANTGGLDYNSVGMELLNNLFHSFSEISHKAAAYATGVHLGYLDSGILKKAAVDSYLAKFIFNKNYFFACIGFFNEFFDKRGLSRAQKTGENIYLCHFIIPFFAVWRLISLILTHINPKINEYKVNYPDN